MAALKGLQMIAVTDHNSARNLPAVKKCCDAYNLLMIPGMEITTKEEVHLLGYFETVEKALEFDPDRAEIKDTARQVEKAANERKKRF